MSLFSRFFVLILNKLFRIRSPIINLNIFNEHKILVFDLNKINDELLDHLLFACRVLHNNKARQ